MSEGSERGKRGIGELAEDAVGFGAAELRLTRDLFLRPRAVMAAYDAHGATAGGLYPKPLRYWLTLNGLILLLTGITGAFETDSPYTTEEDFAQLARRAGKSVEEFRADFEQWMSLVTLPANAVVLGGALFLLIRHWSPADDRQDFRQTFTFLNAWSLWGLPLLLAAVVLPTSEALMLAGLTGMLVGPPLIFGVFGAGRWWRTRRGAWLKGGLLLLVSAAAVAPYMLISAGMAFAGAMLLP